MNYTTKKIHWCILLLIALSMSSCLHIIEEITIRKDGSGSYRFVIDASEIGKMADGFGKKQDKKTAPEENSFDKEVSIPSKTDTVVTKEKENVVVTRMLKTREGIHNAVAVNDSATFQSGYAFDFDHIEYLESAMESLEPSAALGLWSNSAEIQLKGNQFRRLAGGRSLREIFTAALNERSGEDGASESAGSGFMRVMFGSLRFEQVYHFPDKKIKSCNHKGATISSDRHTIRIIEKPFADEKDKKRQKQSSELKIRLK